MSGDLQERIDQETVDRPIGCRSPRSPSMVHFQAKVATISARPVGPFWLGLRWLTAGRLVAEAVSECQVERNREKRVGWVASASCVFIIQKSVCGAHPPVARLRKTLNRQPHRGRGRETIAQRKEVGWVASASCVFIIQKSVCGAHPPGASVRKTLNRQPHRGRGRETIAQRSFFKLPNRGLARRPG